MKDKPHRYKCACCTRIGNMIVSVSPTGRLRVGGRYIWIDYHHYTGPSFTRDAAGGIPYDPVDENDPVWPAFDKWLKKFNAAKNAQQGS